MATAIVETNSYVYVLDDAFIIRESIMGTDRNTKERIRINEPNIKAMEWVKA